MEDLPDNIFESGPMPTPMKIFGQSSEVVNWIITKPSLEGNHITFGGTRFGFVKVSIIEVGYPLS